MHVAQKTLFFLFGEFFRNPELLDSDIGFANCLVTSRPSVEWCTRCRKAEQIPLIVVVVKVVGERVVEH